MKSKYVFLITLALGSAACKKLSDPNSQTSESNMPTYTIGNGGTDTIVWFPMGETKNGPSRTALKQYLERNDTVVVVVDSSYASKESMSLYTTGLWNVVADSLAFNKQFANPKTIIYSGKLYVNSENGANMPDIWQLPGCYDKSGMSASTNLRLTNLGFAIKLFNDGRGNKTPNALLTPDAIKDSTKKVVRRAVAYSK